MQNLQIINQFYLLESVFCAKWVVSKKIHTQPTEEISAVQREGGGEGIH